MKTSVFAILLSAVSCIRRGSVARSPHAPVSRARPTASRTWPRPRRVRPTASRIFRACGRERRARHAGLHAARPGGGRRNRAASAPKTSQGEHGAPCLPQAPAISTPRGPDLNWAMTKMIQTPSLIVVLNPDLTYRQIFMDGRALETERIRVGWAIRSGTGRETPRRRERGLQRSTWLDGGYPHTEALRTIERYRRPDFGHLTHRGGAPRSRVVHRALEGHDRGAVRRRHGDARVRLQREQDVPRALGRHALGRRAIGSRDRCRYSREATRVPTRSGRRSGKGRRWRDVFEIRFADGALFLGQTRLSPQSETVFVNRGLAIEFVRTPGRADDLWDKHVSGDYRFDRVR